MTFCSHCGTSNKNDAKYCKNCGAQLSSTNVLTCPKCGVQNPTNSLFCNRCGERLGSATALNAQEHKTTTRQTQVKTVGAKGASTSTGQTLAPPTTRPAERPLSPRINEADFPDWVTRFFSNAPAQKQLIPTHELLKMANALGIDVDYSTLRFWQKRGLVPKPLRGPVSTGRGTRGYYDPSLIDRLLFIRDVQKNHSLGLESIRDELLQIDKKIAQANNVPVSQIYRNRIAELQAQRDIESKRTLVAVLSKALGIEPTEIKSVSIEKSNGQVVRLLSELVPDERNRR